jgi:hypothetical protein
MRTSVRPFTDPNPNMTPQSKPNLDRVRRYLTPLLALSVALPAFAQVANNPQTPPPAEQKPVPVTQTPAANSGTGDKGVLELSPFVVTTSKDQGYFAENTLAGSRLNSNLADLAASITVVTKQQLDDTASLDINDVFRYEAGTEGSTTYTPQVTDRGTLKDTVGGYSFGNNGDTTTNSQSNRVRGLAAPDASINYHPSNNRVPFDSYNIQSVEISRGPNSLLFGLGSPAGIVNQSSAQAVINRNSNTVSLRTDHLGSVRGSFALNRSLIEDKLAVYVAALYNNQQFERKPSYDLTKRQFGAITYRPFPKTVIRAFAENFDNKANRPNFITPRDMVTPWLKAGRPSYDPVTRTIKFMDATSYPKNLSLPQTGANLQTRTAGEVIGPIYFDTRSPGSVATIVAANGQRLTGAALLTNSLSPYYLPAGLGFDTGNTNTLERFDNGTQIDYITRNIGFFAPAHTNPATATPTNGSWLAGDQRFLVTDRNWTSSTTGIAPVLEQNGTIYTFSSYQAPGVTDQSIYDWTNHNLNQPNFGILKAGNYNIEIEQQIGENLFLSAGWYRQQIDAAENYTISQLQGNTLQVDTNINKLDGTPNPYYGLAFVPLGLGGGVDTFFSPETNDSTRVMAAYNLDFSKNSGWTKWFGRHRLLGLAAQHDVRRNRERWRLTYTDGDVEGKLRYTRNLTLDGQAHWSAAAIRKAYYAASPGDPQGTVTQSLGFYGNPGWENPYVAQVRVFNIAEQAWKNVTTSERIAFADNGSANFQREVSSWTLATQSYLWQDRLVLTLGLRNDQYRARNTTGGTINALDGSVIAPALTGNEIYRFKNGEADYDRIMNRWNIWDELEGDTKTVGAAFRPLTGWNRIENSANNGNHLSDFLRGLTLYYNQSDNFNPPPGKQTDYFKKQLPKPTGDGKDGGFGFNLFDNKLVARVNWFQTENQNERTSAAGTLLTRLAYSDTTTGYAWASAVQRLRVGMAAGRTIADITADPDWNTDNVAAGGIDVSSTANQQKIYESLKLPFNYYSGIQLAATQQSIAKGVEVQLTYNPTRNWTMKFTGTKTKSTYTDVAPQYDDWLAERLPVWQTLTAPDIPDFIASNGREWSLKNFWTGYGFHSSALKENLNGQTSPQAYHQQVVESEVALAKALEGAVSPNQRIYRASFLTNYNITEGRFKGFAVGGAQRYESKAAVGYYGKAANPLLPTVINASDITRPVYLDNGNFYTDLWASYTRRIFNDKVRMKVQLNVNNVMEDGGLRPVAVNWDGKPWGFRIIDPRQFILTTTFDF